MTAGRGRV